MTALPGGNSADPKGLDDSHLHSRKRKRGVTRNSKEMGGFDRDATELKTDVLTYGGEKSDIFVRVFVLDCSLRSGLGILIENSRPIHRNSHVDIRECQNLRLVGGACSHERTLLSL